MCSAINAIMIGLTLLAAHLASAQDTVNTMQSIRRGEIVAVQTCVKNSGQGYALFVPSYYVPDKRWPVVYVMDPGARGVLPLEKMKSAAEVYGYILAGSNNSRNGPWQPEAEAAQAMWNDTHQLLSIDDHRVYFAGLSGGARTAALLAQGCKCAQGVLLNGAGFSAESPPRKEDSFAVFATVGFVDFNYSEMVALDASLADLGKSHFLRRFDGTHQWAPPEVWEEAFAWMDLVAIKNNIRSHDSALVARELAKALARAQDLEQSGALFWELQDVRGISALFHGLVDNRVIDERLASLEKSDAVAEAKEAEKKEIDEERRLEAEMIQKAELLRNPNAGMMIGNEGGTSMSDLRSSARDAVARIRKKAENKDQPGMQRVNERARAVVFSYFTMNAQAAFEQNDQHLAQIMLELAIEARPDQWGPQVLLARSFLKTDDKDGAIEALQHARKLGLTSSELVDLAKRLSELSQLSDEPAFKRLIEEKSTGNRATDAVQ